jgi:hypothetical protein
MELFTGEFQYPIHFLDDYQPQLHQSMLVTIRLQQSPQANLKHFSAM